MTPLGWIMMLSSVAAVLGLTAFCLVRVLNLPPADVESLNTAPLEIDTGDTKFPD
jgi:hypothetical protein